jgi:hypothetical protein
MFRSARMRGLVALGLTTMIAAAALLAWQGTGADTASAQAPTGGMTLAISGCTSEPCGIAPGSPFTVAVVANPVPQVPISGFDSEVYFGGLEWIARAACEDELQVGREDASPVSQCVADVGPDGEARHVVISEINVPPLAALAVATGDTLLELDSECPTTGGDFSIALTAVTNGENDAPFGAVYFADDTSQIQVTTSGTVDIGGETRAVADTIDISCSGTIAPPTLTPPLSPGNGLSPQPTLVDTGSGGASGDDSNSFAVLAGAAVLLAATAAGFGLNRWRSGREA